MGRRGNETEQERAARKEALKAEKAERRAIRQGQGPVTVGQKECTLCRRPRDLLIRCQVDATGKWHMACGRCWRGASGGQVDGTMDKPHYRYGGLWKNLKRQVGGSVGRASDGSASAPSVDLPRRVARSPPYASSAVDTAAGLARSRGEAADAEGGSTGRATPDDNGKNGKGHQDHIDFGDQAPGSGPLHEPGEGDGADWDKDDAFALQTLSAASSGGKKK